MNFRLVLGISLLTAASLCLIAAAVYTHFALNVPEEATVYTPYRFVIMPTISTAKIIGFVVVEHLLVGAGVALIIRSTREAIRRWPTLPQTDLCAVGHDHGTGTIDGPIER